MTELNLIAVQNAAVLRALRDRPEDGYPSFVAMGDAIGRDPSNLRKTLNVMADAGLVHLKPLTEGLTFDGLAQLDAIDLAEGLTDQPATARPEAPDLPEGLLTLRHDQILPDPDNARQDWTSEEARWELDALRMDIVQNGLLQNLVVRLSDPFEPGATVTTSDDPAEGYETTRRTYVLVAGERRWRAIGEAIQDGDWEPDAPIIVRLLDTDARETRFAAIAENLLRRKLNPIEKATGFEQLAELGFENKLIAERLGYTPEHVQQHRRFLKLDEADQQRMTLSRDDPRHLSVRDARQKLSNATAEAEKAAELQAVPNDERLMAAEVLHAIITRTNYSWADLIVGPGIAEDEIFVRLKQRDWLRGGDLHKYGAAIGHHVVSRSYGLPFGAFPWFFGKDEAAIAAGLKDAQREAGHPDVDGYVTPWLGPDPERSAEGKAMLEAAEAERAQAAERQAQRQATIDANLQRFRDARARHAAILNAAQERADAGAPEENVAIAAEIERPLPWTVAGDVIRAANGQTVRRVGDGYGMPGDRDIAVAQMIVVGVNTAAGLTTPACAFDDEPDEEQFTEWLVAQLRLEKPDDAEEALEQAAAEILSSFLTDNSVEFGDEGFAWDEDAAAVLVDEHLNPEGDQDEAA